MNIVEPDVGITKRVDNLTPQPGDTFNYTIELSNTDVADAFAIVVTDDIPAGIAVDPTTIRPAGTLSGTTDVLAPDGVTTVQVGGTITWNIATLAKGATLPLTYSATLAPSSTLGDDEIADGIVNTASLDEYSSLTTGGRPYTGGEATAKVTPRFPKLEIVKEPLGDVPTYIGSEFGWRITVTNVGDGDAELVSLIDTLPTNWQFVLGSAVVTAPGPVGTTAPGVASTTSPLVETLTWADLGPLPVDQSLTVTIRTRPTTDVSDVPGVGRSVEQTNTAEANAEDATGATGNGTTPDGGSYGSGETTAVAFIDAADVVVVKGNTAPSAIAGNEYSWTVDVRNDGPDTAVGPFVVTDTLPTLTPEPLTFVRAVGDGWACTETSLVVTCRRIDTTQTLSSGDAFPTITVTVRVPSDYLAPPAALLSNTAVVSARTFDPVTANNTSTVTTPASGEADLRLVKRRGIEQIVAGEPLTYFLDVTNLGPSTSRADITVTDTLPPEVTFRGAPTTAAGDPWNCVFAPNGAEPTGGRVTCTLVGTPGGALLANQAAPQIPILVDVVSGAKPDVEIVNTAVVASSGTTDPDLSNNTSENRGRPDVSADLAIDKNATGRLVAGTNATYRMVVVNNGPSDAENVRIVDDLPAGLTYVGFTDVIGSWSCPTAVGATSFRCDLTGDLVAGDSASVDIEVAVASGVLDTVVNFATVESDTFDPVPENNTDGDTSEFGTIADLAIQKTNTGSPVKAGENVTWNLVVTNNGPSDSQPVISVTDRLPASVEYVSASGDGWACTDAPSPNASFSSVVTCTRAAVLTARQGIGDIDDDHIAPPIVLVARVLPGSGPGRDRQLGDRGAGHDRRRQPEQQLRRRRDPRDRRGRRQHRQDGEPDHGHRRPRHDVHPAGP